MIDLPDDLPGQNELNTMCQNARRVVTLCDAIGAGRRDLTDELVDEIATQQGATLRFAADLVEDGSWIDPEDF